MIVSPSPESLNLPFQLETDFILPPFDLRCLVVEAAAEPMERTEEEEGGIKRGGEREEEETEVGVEAKEKRLRLRAAVVVPPAPILCRC